MMDPRRAWRGSPRGEAGIALLSVLILIAALTPLVAFAVMQARSDLLVHEHTRLALEVFTAAESGLEHALAEVRHEATFDRLLRGPDGEAGTADDHLFPFRAPPPAFFPAAPYRYDVEVAAREAGLVDVIARGCGPGQAAHAVAATVRPAEASLPGAMVASAGAVRLNLGDTFTVTGFDRAGGVEARPALAVPNQAAADMLRGSLPAETATRLQGAEGTPSLGVRDAGSVEALADAFVADGGARAVDGGTSGAWGSGLFVSAASLDVTAAEGAGVLIVNGNLHVIGAFTFAGLVIVHGDIRADANSDLRVTGALLQGRGRGEIDLLGAGAVAYDSTVIAQVDAAFPGRLPRSAVILGRRDL